MTKAIVTIAGACLFSVAAYAGSGTIEPTPFYDIPCYFVAFSDHPADLVAIDLSSFPNAPAMVALLEHAAASGHIVDYELRGTACYRHAIVFLGERR